MIPKLELPTRIVPGAKPIGPEPQPGYKPFNTACLFMPDPAPEKSAGGIYYTEQEQEHMALAEVRGTLLAVGDMAFKDVVGGRVVEWEGEKPIPGCRIIVAKYAGVIIKGLDNRTYRVIQDKDIAAVEAALTKEIKMGGSGVSRMAQAEGKAYGTKSAELPKSMKGSQVKQAPKPMKKSGRGK